MHKILLLGTLTLLAFLPLNGQSRKKVVITSAGPFYARLSDKDVDELRAAAPGIELVFPKDEARILAEAADADGIIGVINPKLLKAARKLKWVQIHVAGAEPVLFPEFRNSEAVLTNCKITQGPEIADHSFAMLLAFTRDLYRIIPRRTEEKWRRAEYKPIELQGKTALVVGMGGIGTQIAVRAKAFGMRVIGLDPKDTPLTPFLDEWHPPDWLQRTLPQADAVFVAAPHTAETKHMFGGREFGLMKRGAYFIAVSRGGLYDMDALVDALREGKLGGAGVDVTDPAEPLPAGHPLWRFENVIITPHIAGRSDGEHARYMAVFKENLRRFSQGLPLIHVVDKQRGY
jgi:phosphoglycerate dehydrogenase-like enzyme